MQEAKGGQEKEEEPHESVGIVKFKIMPAKKRKSTVNSAGNYTKPTMRKRLFEKIKAGSKGGRAGQWSAIKSNMLAKQYKAAGGGYTTKRKKSK